MTETVIARLNIWTGDDTSEAGPTLDDAAATAHIETTEGGVMVHMTATDEHGDLWTSALYLNRSDAHALAQDLLANLGG